MVAHIFIETRIPGHSNSGTPVQHLHLPTVSEVPLSHKFTRIFDSLGILKSMGQSKDTSERLMPGGLPMTEDERTIDSSVMETRSSRSQDRTENHEC